MQPCKACGNKCLWMQWLWWNLYLCWFEICITLMKMQRLQMPVIYFINSFALFKITQTFSLDVLKSRHGHIYKQSIYWKMEILLLGIKCLVQESWANISLLVGTAGVVIATSTAAELEFWVMQTCFIDPRLSLNWQEHATALLGYLCPPLYVFLPNHAILVHSDDSWDFPLTETVCICT